MKEIMDKLLEGMTFKEALKHLNIEEYGERIFNSSSHGDLQHLSDYIMLAKAFDNPNWFREWFVAVVESAEREWQRPESVFQHIPKILEDHLAASRNAGESRRG